jgi:hypothetical protein
MVKARWIVVLLKNTLDQIERARNARVSHPSSSAIRELLLLLSVEPKTRDTKFLLRRFDVKGDPAEASRDRSGRFA